MGVMECDRKGCTSIMCDKYNSEYGYICNGCFNELCESNLEINEFMESRKDYNRDIKIDSRRDFLNKIFT